MLKEHFVEKEPKFFFQVMIAYEDCEATAEIPEDERMLESAAIDSWDNAESIAKNTIEQIQTNFPDTNLIELDLDQASDGYHLLLKGSDGNRVAGVGVTFTDYTDETIH